MSPSILAEAFKVTWYMLHFGSKTPKPHVAFSNSRAILKLYRGKLRWWRKQCLSKQLVRKYMDGRGKKRYVGTARLTASGT